MIEKENEKQGMRAKHALIAALRSCSKKTDLHGGTRVHADLLKQGLLGTCSCALITMYAKCAAPATAHKLLIELPVQDVFAWTALIAAYAQQGQGHNALLCYERMQREGLSADAVTFTSILKACGSIGALEKGEEIHHLIAKRELLVKNVVLGTALIDMYAKCCALAKAHEVLKDLSVQDVISWNTYLSGCVQHGQVQDALKCFEEMQHRGFSPNASTFICMLKVYGNIKAVDKGRKVHDEIVRLGLLGDNPMLGKSLVDMYIKCSTPSKAQQVLEELAIQDVVLWSALITKYVQQGQGEKALNCFDYIERMGMGPDAVTFICVLKACGTEAAVVKGELVHDEIVKQGLLGTSVELGSALVDMYTKCGALLKARQLLDELPFAEIVSWSALIAGYARQGLCRDVVSCFEQMQRKGLSPSAVTFSCVLNACSQAGLVQEGEACFVDMSRKYGITPDLDHYVCMIDMFGRAGHFDKAVAVIENMPSSDHLAAWSALLGSSRKRGEINVARWAFDNAIQIDKRDATLYIDMTNVYIAAGLKKHAENIEVLRVQNRV